MELWVLDVENILTNPFDNLGVSIDQIASKCTYERYAKCMTDGLIVFWKDLRNKTLEPVSIFIFFSK